MFSIFRKEDDIQNKCYKLNSLIDSIKSSNNPSYSTQKKITENTVLFLD